MERLIIIVGFLLFVQCTNNKKTTTDSRDVQLESAESNVLTTESMEIPDDIDSIVHTVLPQASIFWLLEQSVLMSWPENMKDVIQEKICKEDSNTEFCTPNNFNIINLNDSLELVIDYSTNRSGSAGTPYYVYNSKSGKFISRSIGTVYGIVKSEGFIGFVFHFRYSGANDFYESYVSLEEIKGNQLFTRAILTPNVFSSLIEQKKDFEKYKSYYVTNKIE